jgi:uncharacterized protein DUF6166
VRTSVYSGTRESAGRTFVNVDGRPLATGGEFRWESATAFDWGYEGRGGPAQLALAILADHLGDHDQARRHHELFLRRVIRWLPSDAWILTGPEIDAVLPGGGH